MQRLDAIGCKPTADSTAEPGRERGWKSDEQPGVEIEPMPLVIRERVRGECAHIGAARSRKREGTQNYERAEHGQECVARSDENLRSDLAIFDGKERSGALMTRPCTLQAISDPKTRAIASRGARRCLPCNRRSRVSRPVRPPPGAPPPERSARARDELPPWSRARPSAHSRRSSLPSPSPAAAHPQRA